jgi:sterol 3beta-glucosyltransferase
MRIVLLARGTRGDVQPMVLLAAELRRRGHEVLLGSPPDLVNFAMRAGVDARPVGPDFQAFLKSAEGQTLLASGNAKALTSGAAKLTRIHLEQTHSELLQIVDGADLIVAGVLLTEHAASIAEAKRIPVVLIQFAPWGRTRNYPAFPLTTRQMGGLLNLLTWTLMDRIVWQAIAFDVNRVRSWLDLPAARARLSRRTEGKDVLQIQAFSAKVVPGISDYGVNQPVVGFFTASEEDRRAFGESAVDPELESWLSAGQAPAYFGFGSMPISDLAACVQMIERVTQRLGLRALISAGWSDLGGSSRSNEDLRFVGALNHHAVLPRCRVAIHHGGAGTTAASISAGLPTLVCSLTADQPFWGAQLARLGVGAHIRFSELDAARLERALRGLLRPEASARARALADAMRYESNAVSRAAELIEARSGKSATQGGAGSVRPDR